RARRGRRPRPCRVPAPRRRLELRLPALGPQPRERRPDRRRGGAGRRRGHAGRAPRRRAPLARDPARPALTERRPMTNGEPPRKQKIEPGDGLHPLPWPYSHGWRIGDMLFIAGQVALDEELRLIGPGDAEEQARQVWRNIQAVCEKAGGKVTDVVRVST